MISDSDAFAMSRNILKSDYFDPHLRPAARYILEYADKANKTPNVEMIRATSNVAVEQFTDPYLHRDWYLETIEGFCRFKALELTILDGLELLEKGAGSEVERRVREAMTISISRDLGTDYFYDPLGRLERMKDRSNFVSTGWAVLDQKLHGGFTPGTLNIWAGGSGSGKSLFLQNLALNWADMGLRVIYITLELSEDLVSLRFDAMVTSVSTTEIFKSPKEAAIKVKARGRTIKSGSLTVKKFPEAGTTTNDLRAFIKEYELKTGHKPDAIVVDYLDLMHPNSGRVDPTNLFAKDKYTSEELRALAGEYNILMATASQLNRQSVEAVEFDHSHIAGGISKINTADNVFGIFTSASMRESGRYQIQFLKTRSASAVGQKIELAYCPISMRITDPDTARDIIKPKSSAELRSELKERAETKTEVPKLASPLAADPQPPAPSSSRARINDLLSNMRRKES
jgi:archaellum biogenesis ATPase FlaH